MSDTQGSIFITGANGGLGSALVAQICSSELASKYHGIYTVRNVETAKSLQQVLASAPPSHKHDEVALDLSSLSQVRDIATTINKRVAEASLPRIKALILNAGYQEHTEQHFSEDGFDMSFQCNFLSHWLLTLMLLQSMDRSDGRIVVLGSSTHDPYDSRNDSVGMFKDEHWKVLFHDTESLAKGTWSSSKDDPTSKAGFRRYGAAKLCEVMMIYELQKRLNSDPELFNIAVIGVDPGGMPSGLTRRGSWMMNCMMKVVVPVMASILVKISENGPLRTTTKSASDVLRAAFDTKSLGEHPKGLYLNGSEHSETSAEARDSTKQGMLWTDSIMYAALKVEETLLKEWN